MNDCFDPKRRGLPGSWAAAPGVTPPESLRAFVAAERASATVLPEAANVFAALYAVEPHDVRVVILGQDPYPTPGQACGLAFAIPPGWTPIPRSLINIVTEIRSELGAVSPEAAQGDLRGWCSQGVLLLNTVLTVRAHEPGSHRGHGWEGVTDALIRAVDSLPQPIVFMLWGNDARTKTSLLRPATNRLVLTAPHPSPLSARRGFFGCGHFAEANRWLVSQGQKPIAW